MHTWVATDNGSTGPYAVSCCDLYELVFVGTAVERFRKRLKSDIPNIGAGVKPDLHLLQCSKSGLSIFVAKALSFIHNS